MYMLKQYFNYQVAVLLNVTLDIDICQTALTTFDMSHAQCLAMTNMYETNFQVGSAV